MEPILEDEIRKLGLEIAIYQCCAISKSSVSVYWDTFNQELNAASKDPGASSVFECNIQPYTISSLQVSKNKGDAHHDFHHRYINFLVWLNSFMLLCFVPKAL